MGGIKSCLAKLVTHGVAWQSGNCTDVLCGLFFVLKQGETLETITTAAVCLFSAQPQLADQVPPLGHLPKILQAMNHKNNAIPKSAMRVIHILADNEVLGLQSVSNGIKFKVTLNKYLYCKKQRTTGRLVCL